MNILKSIREMEVYELVFQVVMWCILVASVGYGMYEIRENVAEREGRVLAVEARWEEQK